MLLTIIGMIITFLCGLLLGGYVFYLLMMNALDKDPQSVLNHLIGQNSSVKMFNSDNIDELLDSLEESELDTLNDCLELVAETHGTQVYLFEDITDRFVSQGATLEEAVSRAHERHPGTNFSVWMDEPETTNDNS